MKIITICVKYKLNIRIEQPRVNFNNYHAEMVHHRITELRMAYNLTKDTFNLTVTVNTTEHPWILAKYYMIYKIGTLLLY